MSKTKLISETCAPLTCIPHLIDIKMWISHFPSMPILFLTNYYVKYRLKVIRWCSKCLGQDQEEKAVWDNVPHERKEARLVTFLPHVINLNICIWSVSINPPVQQLAYIPSFSPSSYERSLLINSSFSQDPGRHFLSLNIEIRCFQTEIHRLFDLLWNHLKFL